MLGQHSTTELYPNTNKPILALPILNLYGGYGLIDSQIILRLLSELSPCSPEHSSQGQWLLSGFMIRLSQIRWHWRRVQALELEMLSFNSTSTLGTERVFNNCQSYLPVLLLGGGLSQHPHMPGLGCVALWHKSNVCTLPLSLRVIFPSRTRLPDQHVWHVYVTMTCQEGYPCAVMLFCPPWTSSLLEFWGNRWERRLRQPDRLPALGFSPVPHSRVFSRKEKGWTRKRKILARSWGMVQTFALCSQENSKRSPHGIKGKESSQGALSNPQDRSQVQTTNLPILHATCWVYIWLQSMSKHCFIMKHLQQVPWRKSPVRQEI